MKKSQLIFNSILVPVDFLMMILAGISAYYLRTSKWLSNIRPVLFELSMPFEKYLGLVITVSLFSLIVFAILGLYSMKTNGYGLSKAFQIAIAVSASILSIIIYIFLRGEFFNSRFIILAAWLFAIIYVNIGRLIVQIIQHYFLTKSNFGINRVLLLGNEKLTKQLSNTFETNKDLGYIVVKRILKPDIEHLKSILDETIVDEIIVADPDLAKESLLNIYNFCQENRIVFKMVPNLFQALTTNIEMDISTGIPIIEIKKTPLDGWGKINKRLIDIFSSIILLILLIPLFLIVAIAIKLDSEGPVFVKLKRISQGKQFLLWKFRSMIKNAESIKPQLKHLNERRDGPLFKIKNDPRVTKVGRFIRKTRIDELPQLINVLKGEMSLVGPRPHQPDEIAQYKSHHKKVLNIKPGITGLAQISGSSDLPFEEEIKLDTYYMENWSLKLDIYILLKTLIIVFRDKSAC